MTMDSPGSPDSATERAVADQLCASRPAPDRGWIRKEERRLFHIDSRQHWAFPQVRVAAAFVLAVAATVLLLSLAGVGPLGGAAREAVQADDNCRYVTVTRIERTPAVVEGADGTPSIVYRDERVSRRVKRC
jgi:hypothetical protein